MHEHAVVADDVEGYAQPEQVRVQPLQLGGDDADVLPALGRLRAVDALDGEGVAQRVGVRADAAHALDQYQRLYGVALGTQLLYAAVVVADEDLGVLDDLAFGVELGVYRLLERRVVGANGYDIAHCSASFLCFPAMFSSRLATSSDMGVTNICPLP